jgi:hypothetical protein
MTFNLDHEAKWKVGAGRGDLRSVACRDSAGGGGGKSRTFGICGHPLRRRGVIFQKRVG